VSTLQSLERNPLSKRSTQAHIWHTKRDRKLNLSGVPEGLSLIGKSVNQT